MPLLIRPPELFDAPTIAAIYNQGIADRGATFETSLRHAADIEPRIREIQRYPLLVATDARGDVIGWAGVTSYRSRPCYDGIGEFSIYLDRASRGQGAGKALLCALVEAATSRGYWKLLSRIFPANAASRARCLACGFREVGIYEKHGCLDGQWLDVVIVERLIPENLSSRPAARPE